MLFELWKKMLVMIVTIQVIKIGNRREVSNRGMDQVQRLNLFSMLFLYNGVKSITSRWEKKRLQGHMNDIKKAHSMQAVGFSGYRVRL